MFPIVIVVSSLVIISKLQITFCASSRSVSFPSMPDLLNRRNNSFSFSSHEIRLTSIGDSFVFSYFGRTIDFFSSDVKDVNEIPNSLM